MGQRVTRIQREDEILLSAAPARVFPVLLDLHSYKDWWPKSIRFQVDSGPVKVGTRMRVSNQGLVRWTAQVVEIQDNKKIVFRYCAGAWEGTAAWTLTPEGPGSRVAYGIDIVPMPYWLKTLSGVLDLGKIHSKMMGDILRSLEKNLI